MMQGGAPQKFNANNPLSRQIGSALRHEQVVTRRDNRHKMQLQREFERRIQNEKMKSGEFEDFDIKVTADMIRSPFGNQARNFAFFNAEADREGIQQGLDPAWYAVEDTTFHNMQLEDKTMSSRNKINGKFVRVMGPNGERVFVVRGHDLEKFLHTEKDPESAAHTLESIVNDLRRKLRMMSRQVVSKQSAVNNYLRANPAAEVRIRDMMRKRTSFLKEKLDYMPMKGKGCDMLQEPEYQEHWKRTGHGTPKNPKPVSDLPQKRERRENKHHKALMALDDKMQGICISPEVKGPRGGSYAEEMYPRTYHHMTAVNNLEEAVKDSETGRELPEERVWGDMSFCVQHGGESEKRCNSYTGEKYPLTDKKKTVNALCRFNDEEEKCEPRWLQDATDDLKNLYHSDNGFFLQEMEYIQQHLRNQKTGYPNMTKTQKKKAKALNKSHRVVSTDSAPTRFVEVRGRSRN